MSLADINITSAEIESSDLVLVQLEIPIETVEYITEMANKKEIKVILNSAPARALSGKLLKYLYMILPNKSDAEILSGIKVTDIESAKHAADFVEQVSGWGRITTKQIDVTLGKWIGNKAEIKCTDSQRSYVSFAKKRELNHSSINANKGQHVKDKVYHIQNTN